MPLETASYIHQFDASIPADTDPSSETSAILRQLKQVLQTQFPNLGNAPVTSTATQLNTGVLPVGAIIAYNGTVVPTGYALCDGGTYARSDGTGSIATPNLIDRFIVGAGNLFALGATGGTNTANATITVNGTVLTLANLPSGNVGVATAAPTGISLNDPGHQHHYTAQASSLILTGGVAASANVGVQSSLTTRDATGITLTDPTHVHPVYSYGTDTAHGHTASGTVSTLSPYYALTYIMKI